MKQLSSTARLRSSAGLVFLAALASCAGGERLTLTPSSLQGVWRGEAIIGLTWADKDQRLPLEFQIDSDGRVSGKVGGATLKNGLLAANRGSLGRALDIKTDYIVRGELEGIVVANEPRSSRFVMAPFNVVEKPGEEPHIWGSVTTWDRPNGGINEIVGARDMVLRRE